MLWKKEKVEAIERCRVILDTIQRTPGPPDEDLAREYHNLAQKHDLYEMFMQRR
jgi:hypothetical protein